MARQEKRERDEARFDGLIEGRNAVAEALRAGRGLEKLYVADGATDATLHRLTAQARQQGVPVVFCDRRKLDGMSATGAHQGVVAACSAVDYVPLEALLDRAGQRGEPPLLVLCDGVTDPHNLGAILRTAEAAGAHGLVIPKRRSAGIGATVGKTSAGAMNYLPVSKVSNLTDAIRTLKKQGVWIYGTAAEGATPMDQADLAGPSALVIGSEGDGMSRLVREQCDFTISIPMMGQMNSLNASAAAAVLLYEAVRQRRGKSENKGNDL